MSDNQHAPGGGSVRNGIIPTGLDHEGCDVYHRPPTHGKSNETENGRPSDKKPQPGRRCPPQRPSQAFVKSPFRV